MADQDLISLYSGKILDLAACIPHTQRLADPDASAKTRSPLCGSTVTVDIGVENGLITRFGQDVKACALGQAAASVIGSAVIGLDLPTIERGRAELNAMLTQDGPPPAAPWEGLHVLAPAKDFRNRHASILLTFDALIAAFAALPQTETA